MEYLCSIMNNIMQYQNENCIQKYFSFIQTSHLKCEFLLSQHKKTRYLTFGTKVCFVVLVQPESLKWHVMGVETLKKQALLD